MPRDDDPTTPERGLYGKYLVFKNDGNPWKSPVPGCFILRPESDPIARMALAEYSRFTPNPELRADLTAWLAYIICED